MQLICFRIGDKLANALIDVQLWSQFGFLTVGRLSGITAFCGDYFRIGGNPIGTRAAHSAMARCGDVSEFISIQGRQALAWTTRLR